MYAPRISGRWGTFPGSSEFGAAVCVRCAVAMRALLDWLQMAAGQLVQRMVTVLVRYQAKYHDGARPAMPGRLSPTR